MSYSAFVNCSCYKDGKTTEPPHKKYLHIDEEGINLEPPRYLFDRDKKRVFKMKQEFDTWKRTACVHENMEAADEYLSNGSGMGAFRHLINELGGKKKYPVLIKYLPTSNDGTLPAKLAEKALRELEKLENETSLEELVILKEKSTGMVKATCSTTTYFIFGFIPFNKFNYCIDKDGFFILENVKEKKREVSYIKFRSKNFIQQKIGKKKYKFVDLSSGEHFECVGKLYPDEEEPTAEYEFLVTTQKATIAEEYQYIIDPLKRLAKASVQTGNPIIWA